MKLSEQSVKQIELSKGKVAIVDAEDYEWLSQWRWTLNSWGYAQRILRTNLAPNKYKYHATYMHRLITNAPKGMEVDHINNDGLDNRRSNLRLVTHKQNTYNRSKGVSSSRFKGVGWSKASKKWQGFIAKDKKLTHLGFFESEIEAAKAYNLKAVEFFGEFANLNTFEGDI